MNRSGASLRCILVGRVIPNAPETEYMERMNRLALKPIAGVGVEARPTLTPSHFHTFKQFAARHFRLYMPQGCGIFRLVLPVIG